MPSEQSIISQLYLLQIHNTMIHRDGTAFCSMHGMHHAVTPYLSEAVEPGGTFCQ